MGILKMLLGADNPAAMWAEQNRGWKGAVGAGLASGPTFEQGLANAAMNGPQGQTADDAYAASEAAKAERLAQINQTSEYLRSTFPDLAEAVNSGMPLDAAWNEAMKRQQPGYGQSGLNPTSDIQNYEYGQSHPGFTDYQTQKGGAAETSLTPTWGIDTDPQSPTYNKPVLGQLNKAGVFVKTQLPSGVQPMDPMALAGGKAEAVVDAKTAGAARAALPGAEVAMKVTEQALTEIRQNAAGMKEWFSQVGALPRGMVVQGGTPMGNFVAATKQAHAEAFMQARNMLKGGGQITDYEGRRGEDAYARMQAAMDTGDQQAYLRALSDFEVAVAEGYAKLQQTAQGGYSAGSPAVTGGAGNKTTSGVTWSVEP